VLRSETARYVDPRGVTDRVLPDVGTVTVGVLQYPDDGVSTLAAELAGLLVVWNDLKEPVTDVLDSDAGTLIDTLDRSLSKEVLAVPYISSTSDDLNERPAAEATERGLSPPLTGLRTGTAGVEGNTVSTVRVGVRSLLALKSVNESEEKQTSYPVSDPPVRSVSAGVALVVVSAPV